MFVVADKQTFGVGGEGGLARATEAEEDGSVLAFHVGIGGAVHGGNALQGQVVVHHAEHALLHLAAVPSVEDYLLTAGDIEGHAGLAVETQLLVVLYFGLAGGVDGEIGLEVLQLLLGRFDEHVADKMSLPCHLHDEAHGHAGVLVGTAESVDHIELFVAQFLLGQVFHLSPHLFAHRVVVVLILGCRPPNGILGILVHHDVFVFGRAAGVDTGHHVDGIQFGQLAFVIASQ